MSKITSPNYCRLLAKQRLCRYHESSKLKNEGRYTIMGAQHIIELNGKRYDTITGKLVANVPHPNKTVTKPAAHKTTTAHKHVPNASAAASKSQTPSKRRATNIDGFRRTGPMPPHKRPAAKPNHAARHPQRSQTLMRAPAKAQTIQSISAETPGTVAPATSGFIAPSAARVAFDPQRLKRAQSIPQNKFIGRFQAKATPPAIAIEQAITKPLTTDIGSTSAQPASAPAPINQFEQAIAKSTSHTQPKPAKASPRQRAARKLHLKPRTMTAVSVALLAGILVSAITYQKLPNIHMKVASSRAGISGILPSYIPSGYSLDKSISYKAGEITLNFTSNSDNRHFVVTQTESFWTSELLRQNYVEPLHVDYQTVQQNGKTIYLYNNSATWVDGGIWYRVDSQDANLSAMQLSKLADSL